MPSSDTWNALAVGKSSDPVFPVRYALPYASSAIPFTSESDDPPRYVE
jgi:hypothetical protein